MTTQGPRQHRFQTLVSILVLALAMLTATAHAQQAVTVVWSANPEPDIAGYEVHLGTSSGTYTSIHNAGNATSAVLSGLLPSTTYYCAVRAYNTAGLSSALSDEIAFTTQTTTGLFNNWAAGGGLTGSAAAPDAVPFKDGVPNLVKYAFNMNSVGPDRTMLAQGVGTEGLPFISLERNATQTWFKIEFLRRKGNELAYVPKISTDLVNFVPMTGTTTITSMDEEWERVIVGKLIDTATTPKLFGIVEVTQLQTPASLFSSWATSSGLGASVPVANAMPFNDGVPNLLKYAYNLNPSGPDRRVLVPGTGTAGLPLFAFDAGGPQPVFKVEFLRRKNSGLVYTPKISTDLVNYEPMTGATTLTSIDADWERVIVSKPIDTATVPKLFGIVEVTLP